MKPVRIRPLADREVDELADYIAQDNLDAALRFLDAVQKTFDLISEHPGIGSPRFAHLPMLEGMRVCAVTDFESYLVFYLERETYVDVLRVLYGARDIPAILSET